MMTDDDTRSFCGQCRSRSDCTECAVWYLIYTVHVFILDYNWTVSLSCNGKVFLTNEKNRIYLFRIKRVNGVQHNKNIDWFKLDISRQQIKKLWLKIKGHLVKWQKVLWKNKKKMLVSIIFSFSRLFFRNHLSRFYYN